MVLDEVVLLGRTLDEYRRYFALDLDSLRGRKVLDVAGGVSSFSAEAAALGIHTTAFDAIYELPPGEIRSRCERDLDLVTGLVRNLETYRWDFYRSPENLRLFRERAYQAFLGDYGERRRERYVPGRLPNLPFARAQFDLTLVSYLLFVYEDHFDYEFHKRSLLEIMRVTRGEARLYPVVSFEARRSPYIEQLRDDPELAHCRIEIVPTDFEFLLNSNFYLRVRHRPGA